jgi:putative spermidine/putrescine transport system substrate-binding protein
MGLIYDRYQLRTPPASVNELWDPRWQGRVLAYNGGSHCVSLAALSLGLPEPFKLREGDWRRSVERLVALRRNVLGFYTQPAESVRLFRRHRVALMFANYGSQQLRLLQDAGANVGYALPREGALAWLDCWAITRRCRDSALAHAWIDHLLGDQAAALLTQRQGLASTLHESPAAPASARLHWLQPVEDAARRELLWSRIRAGAPLERVLAV